MQTMLALLSKWGSIPSINVAWTVGCFQHFLFLFYSICSFTLPFILVFFVGYFIQRVPAAGRLPLFTPDVILSGMGGNIVSTLLCSFCLFPPPSPITVEGISQFLTYFKFQDKFSFPTWWIIDGWSTSVLGATGQIGFQCWNDTTW